MVKIILPVDSTFLSEVIYEGVLQYKYHNGSFIDAFKNILERIPKDKTLNLSGNDISMIKRRKGKDILRVGFPEQILQQLDNKYTNEVIYDRVKARKNYRNLLSTEFIKELLGCKDLENTKLKNGFQMELKKDEAVVDKKEITAPQILKVDRYTGYTSLETRFVTGQLTLYVSKEIALLALLGIYSSFVTTFRQQQTYYYFLFFSPEEILRLIDKPSDKVRKYFLVKNIAIERLSSVLERSTLNELLLLEILLSVELQKLMDQEQLDKISLMLFKIAPEGQTYKIYEQIPMTIFRKPSFYQVINKYFRDPKEFCKKISEVLAPDRVIFKAIASLNTRNKLSEADNALKAIQELYRFVILGDPRGWFGFIRELQNCYSKLANSPDGRERSRAKEYLGILRSLPTI